jgi:hypothetical protein
MPVFRFPEEHGMVSFAAHEGPLFKGESNNPRHPAPRRVSSCFLCRGDAKRRPAGRPRVGSAQEQTLPPITLMTLIYMDR